jgi:hypothetical protein
MSGASHLTNSHRQPTFITTRLLGFLALAMIAMTCNIFLIRQLDRIGPIHHASESPMLTRLETSRADSSSLLAQITSLRQTIQELRLENEQVKQSLYQVTPKTERKLQRQSTSDKAGSVRQGGRSDIDNESTSHKEPAAQLPLSGDAQRSARRRIMADSKVSAFQQALNHSTPLPDAIPLDYTTLPDAAGNSIKSSVDYHACCGLGHRLSRMSDANYVAQRLNLGLRSFWGFCGNREVFYYLFGPQRGHKLRNVTDTGNYLRISE